jgi:hypothetical protein
VSPRYEGCVSDITLEYCFGGMKRILFEVEEVETGFG